MKQESARQLEPVFDELVSRAHGLDINGKPLSTPGIPSDAELEQAENAEEAITKPFEQEPIEVHYKHPDGTIEHKTYDLETSMKAHRRCFRKRQAEGEALQEQYEKVCAEIMALQEEVANGTDPALERFQVELNAELAEIERMKEAFQAQDVAAAKEILRKEKAELDAMNRKIEMFIRALTVDDE